MDVEHRQRIRRTVHQAEGLSALRRWERDSIAPLTIWFAPYEAGVWGWFAWCSTTSERVGQDFCQCWDDVPPSVGTGIRRPDSWQDGGRRIVDRRLPSLAGRVAENIRYVYPAVGGRAAPDVGWIWLLVAYHRGDHIEAVSADPVTYVPFCAARGATFAEAVTAVLGGMAPPRREG